MVEAPQADELAVRELERQLLESRRPISERRARAVAAAEREMNARLAVGRVDPSLVVPVYPPCSWHGANQQDRAFRSLTFFPLRGRPRGLAYGETLVHGQAARPSRTTRWLHGLLTGLELLALAVLVVVVVLLNRRLQSIELPAPVAWPTQALPRPDVTPSPFATAPVLPGAHPAPTLTAPHSVQTVLLQETLAHSPTPTVSAELTPTPTETAAPDGIAPLGPVLLAETPTLTLTPTPTPRTGTYIVIPSINVDAPIVEGDTAADLAMGVGHHLGSANPGEPGNMVVSAHNDIHGEIFRDLNKLAVGDEVFIHTDAAVFRYIVRSVEIVAPSRVDVMDPTDHGVLTMITCYPYLLDTHRVVVVADLAE